MNLYELRTLQKNPRAAILEGSSGTDSVTGSLPSCFADRPRKEQHYSCYRSLDPQMQIPDTTNDTHAGCSKETVLENQQPHMRYVLPMLGIPMDVVEGFQSLIPTNSKISERLSSVLRSKRYSAWAWNSVPSANGMVMVRGIMTNLRPSFRYR